MSSPPAPPDLWTPPSSAPQGKYHIVKPLKLGGTAAIYLAIMRGENNFSREVVIKRPLPHLVAQPRARHMFIDEAHIASRLSHPNICQVLDLVAREDELYIVLEYLRGVDLREILKRCILERHYLSPEVAVWIAIEIAAGLGFAHGATTLEGSPLNLVHRDVSPKNIRITFEGSVKVIDFGIARAERRITRTSEGTIKGTLGYMSPEQILGDAVDQRSDIFAFGIVLFQMLTLRNPFDGATLKERVRRLTMAPIPSVTDFNAALDDDIATIVARCLERGAEDRYQHLSEVQVALDQYLARLQVVSPRQRLIDFLRHAFPTFEALDVDLKTALSEVSQFSGPVDASVRLRFPDDPPTEPMSTPRGGPSLPTQPAAAANPAHLAGEPGPAREPSQGTGGAGPTKPLTPALSANDRGAQPAQASGAWSDPGISDTRRIDEFASSPGGSPPAEPWGWRSMLVAAVIAMLVAVVVTVLSWPRPAIEIQQVEKNPRASNSFEPPARPSSVTAAAAAQGTTAKTSGPDSAQAPVSRRKHRPTSPKPKSSRVDRQRARLLFQTGVRLKKQGQQDDAVWLYELAFAYAKDRPDPAIFLNLGLVFNELGQDTRAKACLQGYLQRRPGAPQADRVRTLLSSFPSLPTVPCVGSSAMKRAKTLEVRRGAQVQRWLDATLADRLDP